jgi:hypothetical protein
MPPAALLDLQLLAMNAAGNSSSLSILSLVMHEIALFMLSLSPNPTALKIWALRRYFPVLNTTQTLKWYIYVFEKPLTENTFGGLAYAKNVALQALAFALSAMIGGERAERFMALVLIALKSGKST